MVEALTVLSAIENLPNIATLDPPAPAGDPAVASARSAQTAWANLPLKKRLHIIRSLRHLIADNAVELASSITNGSSAQNRNTADSLVAEVLPLAEACRFLEREARTILQSQTLGSEGRPVWLRGVESEVHRVPLGVILVIAPSNYPLFLPGVQALQALAAGNAVLWKPASGSDRVALHLARLFAEAGLPKNVLQVLDADIDAGSDAIRAGVDKIFLTGHANTGRAVMHQAAETLTPSVMELSGCDAVFVLPGADLKRVAEALAFGLRLNGSATCMAPRRVFATSTLTQQLLALLLPGTERLPAAKLSTKAATLLNEIVTDAVVNGAVLIRDGRQGLYATPTILTGVRPEEAIMQTDVFAPLLAFCPVLHDDEALKAHAACPYALTAAVFGPPQHAEALAARIHAGTVLINDLIVSTADPRVPFGGRGASGFGVTRGREGLLEMTAVKTIIRQTSRSLRPYAQTGAKHIAFFENFIQAIHSRSLGARFTAARKLIASARKVEDSSQK
jgi:acyl-CoA reductase-like NAD-dependent aldehyde dehydrogenase